MIIRQKGQSLVEFTIMLPLLIFIFIGLIEVGYAMANYMSILQSSRELARFVARGERIDFNGTSFTMDNMDVMIDTVLYDISERSNFALEGDEKSAGLYFYLYHIDTGQTCDEVPCPVDCDQLTQAILYSEDDWIIDPTEFVYGMDRDSPFQHEEILESLITNNLELMCGKEKASNEVYWNPVSDVVLVEIIFEQDQLLGFPVISNNLTDPIRLNVFTVMRISYSY